METTFITTLTLATLGVLLLAVAIAAGVALSRDPGRRLSRELYGQGVSEEDSLAVTRAVNRWWRRRIISLAGGAVVGSFLATGYVGFFGVDRGRPAFDILALGAATGAAALGTAVGASRRRLKPSGVRVAHSNATTFVDGTPSSLRNAARLTTLVAVSSMAVAILVEIASSASTGRILVFTPPLVATIVSVLALVLFEILGRAVMGQAARSSSEGDLAADDVVRCLVLRDAALASLSLALVATLLVLTELTLSLGFVPVSSSATNTVAISGPVLACAVLALAAFVPPRLSVPLLHTFGTRATTSSSAAPGSRP